MSELREKMAERLHVWDTEGGLLEQSWESVHPHQRELWLGAADAVLAVLAEPGEDVIERAAVALYESQGAHHSDRIIPDWADAPKSRRTYRRNQARAALRAAFGGEQNDE